MHQALMSTKSGKIHSGKATYALWCAMPRSQREPPTQAGLAEVLGVNERQLERWAAKPGFADAVMSMVLEVVKMSDVAEVINAQVEKAIEKQDTKAARLVLEIVGLIGPRVQVVNNNDNRQQVLEADAETLAWVREEAIARGWNPDEAVAEAQRLLAAPTGK